MKYTKSYNKYEQKAIAITTDCALGTEHKRAYIRYTEKILDVPCL